VSQAAILRPVVALVAWTFIVLLLIPIARFRSAAKGEVAADDFKYGESERVPGAVSIPNRNYMNLLELPVLFYVGCVLLYVVGNVSATSLALAWSYVALRVVHSLIHLTYNTLMHRLTAFVVSNIVLGGLWVSLFAAMPR
jgi:hypothetical protein